MSDLREKIAHLLFRRPELLIWKLVTSEHREPYYALADAIIPLLKKEGLGYVDWEAKVPENPFPQSTSFTGIAHRGYKQAQKDMPNWRPVRRLE